MSFYPNAARQGAVQVVSFSATSAALPNYFGSETTEVRLAATVGCFYVVSERTNPVVATVTNGSYLPPNMIEFVTVSPGQTLAVIAASGSGVLSVTEVS